MGLDQTISIIRPVPRRLRLHIGALPLDNISLLYAEFRNEYTLHNLIMEYATDRNLDVATGDTQSFWCFLDFDQCDAVFKQMGNAPSRGRTAILGAMKFIQAEDWFIEYKAAH